MAVKTAESVAGTSYSPPSTSVAPASPPSRLASLDLIRGVVMVLMAIDHVRVYAGIPAGGPTPGIFFTRWVTHFCAPLFVFLAGTAAFLHGQKLGDRKALSRYLVTRGLMLVILELTVIRFSWSFNADLTTFVLAGVIWMLGWCMVLLAGLVLLSPRTVGWLGVGIVFLQQVFGLIPRALPDSIKGVWAFIYPAGVDAAGGIAVLYVLVPWIGVMAAGYGFGVIMTKAPEERRRLSLRIGISATLLFIVAGTAVALLSGGGGDGAPGDQPPFLFRLLNQQKYPASQLFLLMTLGPAIALIPFAERARGWLANAITVIGRVPLVYYLLHIPVIHISALAVNYLRSGSAHQDWYMQAPFTIVPDEQRWSLALLYLVFAIDVAILYVACRWYANYKAKRPQGLLRYL